MWETPIAVTLILFNIIFIAFIIGIIVFIKEYRRKKEQYSQEIKLINASYKKELLRTRVEIQQNTMKHIGQEIHDSVGQKLTIASLYLKQLLHENQCDQEHSSTINVTNIIDDSLFELRKLSKSLTDDSIKMNSLVKLLENECDKINKLKVCTVIFENETKVDIASYELKSVLFRIAQEFLQNSMKHAKCQHIWVNLNFSKGYLELILKDDGNGFVIQENENKGIGLKNMNKRASLIKADIRLESTLGKGTRLILKLDTNEEKNCYSR